MDLLFGHVAWASNVQDVRWGVPLCLTLHNAEEALGAADLVAQVQRLFPWAAWSARSFVGALAGVTLLAWGIALLAVAPVRTDLLVGLQAVLLLNAFVPHLLLTVRLRRYTPGVATAALLVIPYSFYLLVRLG